MGWHDVNSGGETNPIAQKQPNAWGLYDMHGNVQEWCADRRGGYPGGSVSDPAGAATGQFRVFRGGSSGDSAGACRSAMRSWTYPAFNNFSIGFRLALAPESPPSAPAKVNGGGPVVSDPTQ